MIFWPKIHHGLRPLSSSSREEIESILEKKFPGRYFVLYSSARSAIGALVRHYRLNRAQYVYLPPFSCHCLLNIVSRYATPTPVFDVTSCDLAIPFNQWGFKSTFDFKDCRVIQDSVDSFPVSADGFLCSDSIPEVFSLPKIIGSIAGGVVATNSIQLKSDLISKMDNHLRYRQFALKLSGRFFESALAYWDAGEMICTQMPGIVLDNINRRLELYEEMAKKRRQNIALFQNISALLHHYTSIKDRLPCALMVAATPENEKAIMTSGFEITPRRMCVDDSLKTVLPIPVHHDTDQSKLKNLAEKLKAMEPAPAGH